MLINLRNALMSGKRLPYDAEVEFLQSSGTQWIDTGYAFNSASDKVELVFELLTTTPNYKWIFGAYDASKRFAIGSGDNANRRTFGYNASTSYYSSTYYTDGAHILLADSTGASIDGHKFFGFADFSTTSHIILYSIPIDTPTFCSNARIWSYKHYRNGVLVRDYIPVRKGTVGYLYDRVSGALFGNAGSGDFVLGPDVVPVEYIESTGTQYINPQVSVASGNSFTLNMTGSFTGTSSAMQLHGVNGGAYFGLQTNGNYTVGGQDTGVARDSADHAFALSATIGNSQVVSLGIDGNAYTRTRNNSAGYIGLFNLLDASTGNPLAYYSKFRMKDASITVNSATVRTMKAIRVGTEGAMMDVLTRRIYRNAGTGAFTYGNDLKYPIPAE